MAITSVGTPANTFAASGTSVTGTWGTGQVRTAGDLLVAVASAALASGSTFSPAALTVTSGWTLAEPAEGNSTTASNVCVAVYTKIATGSDTAPTIAGGPSGAMQCMMFELAGASATVDTYVVYGSTSTIGSVTFSLTTAGNVAAAGEYAIAVFAQERLSASLTWGGTGTGWTNLLSGNGSSSVLQTAIDVYAGPPSGAALTDSGSFSNHATSYGAAMIVVFKLGATTWAGAGTAAGTSATAAAVTTLGAAAGTAAGTSVTAAAVTDIPAPPAGAVQRPSIIPVMRSAYY